MSTNCVIKVEDVKYAKVYKHWDGYPSATYRWLYNFNKNFTRKRGEDPTYKFAQLLRSSARDSSIYNLDDSDVTGWGVVPYDDDYSVDYTYILKKDGSVDIEGVNVKELFPELFL